MYGCGSRAVPNRGDDLCGRERHVDALTEYDRGRRVMPRKRLSEMWRWLTGRRSFALQKAADDQVAIEQRTEVVSGKYGVLYRYLEHRHADVTVLTFRQIEDLLGFGLPQLALTYEAWWTLGTNVEGAPHADAWTLAGRTAVPNLQTRVVIFKRAFTARSGLRSPQS